jgi:hypothetical protein
MSDKEPETIPSIEMGIQSIRLEGFEIMEAGQKVKRQLAPDNYEFLLTFNFQLNEVDKTVDIRLHAILSNKDTKEQLALIKTLIVINVINFYEVAIKTPEGLYMLPQGVLALFTSISVSTTRGMSVMCLANTSFSNAFIPVFNAQTFMSQMTIVPFPETKET